MTISTASAPKPEVRGATPRSAQVETAAGEVLQRLFDIVVASVALLLFAPVMLVLYICVRLESPGPAIFRQQRLASDPNVVIRRAEGLPPLTFQLLKFRTMHVDARARFPDLYSYSFSPQQIKTLRSKVDGDPRITRLGRFLRSTSLDELPNFWSVLTGDATLVGPRPEVPEMLRYYSDAELQKFTVKPGVTGYAQVNGRGLLTFTDKTRLDLRYLEQRSFRGDILIIARTMITVLQRHGAF